MRHRVSFLIAAALSAILCLAGCQKGPQREACPTGKLCLEYGNTTEPSSLDPQKITATTEAAIVGELIEGLFTNEPDGSPAPGLAQSWETSPDGLTWTFHLRPSRWSDGSPVTADDFVFAYRRILDPKTASAYAYLVYLLKNGEAINGGKASPDTLGARALDSHTLQLTLEHPAPFLPQFLQHQAYFPVPAKAVKQWGEKWSQPAHYLANGPYRLVAWRLGDYVRIERNPYFREADKICIDRVDFYPMSDSVSAERRVKRGELDVANTIQSSRVAFLRKPGQMPAFVRVHPYLSTTYMIFNTRDVPALKDVRVRQALSMAIDRAFITKKLLRAGPIPTTAVVPARIAGYVPAGPDYPPPYWSGWTLERRQAEARRLLAAAGYGPRHPLKLELKTFNNTDSLLISQSLQADLDSVGADIHLIQNEGQIALQSFNIRDFELGLVGWIADYNDPTTYLGLMKSNTGPQNYGDFKNPTYDALLFRADHEPDGATRAKILAQAEQLMLDDADVAPIQNSVNRNLVSPRVTGWVDNAVDIHRLRYLCMKR
jgi:oligopeptide transport system substrate-binding protein